MSKTLGRGDVRGGSKGDEMMLVKVHKLPSIR